MQTLTINARAEKRLKSGHLWIYSNEINNDKTPLKSVQAGEQAAINGEDGRLVGYALMNPQQLICGKIVARKKPLDRAQLKARLAAALSWREQNYPQPFYRLCYAEGDYLPGLVIDRYDDICVVQLTDRGMLAFVDDIAALLAELAGSRGVLFQHDYPQVDGSELPAHSVVGEVPEFARLQENGVQFLAPLHAGQKTGWFYDHRDNRARLLPLVNGKRVLDVFSYVGGWGIQALAHGAASLTAVDASAFALDCLEQNAALNGFADTVTALQGKAFDALQALIAEGEKFDVIIVDPPAFIKKKKDFNQGLKAYRKANELALRLLDKDGLLMSASCSMHLAAHELQQQVQQAARHVDRELALVYAGGHAADHPVHPAIAETCYLKAQLYRRLG